MNKRRIFRALVCFLVICCILINCSPIRAKAVVTEALVVTGAGVFATMFAIAMGLVAVDLTVQLINGIGDSMTQHLYQWGSSAEKLDEVESFLTLLPPQFDNDSDGDGGDDESSKMSWAIPAGMLAGLIDWAKGLINGEGVEVEGEAPEGYAFYEGVLLPVLPDDLSSNFPWYVIFDYPDKGYYALYTFADDYSYLCADTSKGYVWTQGRVTGGHRYYKYYDSDSWERISSAGGAGTTLGNWLWSNRPIYYSDKTTVYYAGSEPVYVGTETVTIPNYVGDIPQQVKDGTFDEEAFVLPYINYALPFQGQLDAVSALNNLSTQLMDQTLTYDQYMEQIQAEPSTTPDPNPGTDSTDPWEPSSDPDMYALDLKKFFPFCIPFDLYAFFTCLNADPVTPVIEWQVVLPGGSTYPLTIDLSPFNSLAQLLRRLELLAFCVGLAIKTRDLIRG